MLYPHCISDDNLTQRTSQTGLIAVNGGYVILPNILKRKEEKNNKNEGIL